MRFNGSLTSGAATVLTLATVMFITHESIAQDDFPMGFFITSDGPGDGANLGGLAGADTQCQELAEAVGAGARTWRAYLSAQATDDQAAVNARDRIGSGPWHNAAGVVVANNVDELHGNNNLNKETALNERGEVVNGRGDSPNRHDIITGSQLDGTFVPGDEDTTCGNWTSNGAGSAMVGHHDRQGGGANPSSWNSAHGSRGCSQSDLRRTGGDGLFYCFAADLLALLPLDDGTITDPMERADYVHNVLMTWIGDSNVDGEFNSADLVLVFQAGEYEDAIVGNSSWITGDWSGNGDFDSSDLVSAFQDGGYELGPRPAVAAIPEPSSAVLLAIGMIGVYRRRARSPS